MLRWIKITAIRVEISRLPSLGTHPKRELPTGREAPSELAIGRQMIRSVIADERAKDLAPEQIKLVIALIDPQAVEETG